MKITNIRSYLYGTFQGILERGRTGDLQPFGTSEKLDAVVKRVVLEGIVAIDVELVNAIAEEDPVLFTDNKSKLINSILVQMERK